jgi:hypothetical protein
MKKLESAEIYHADKVHTGSTFWKKVAGSSILHAVKQTFKVTDAMDLGSAIHCAVLEPEKFETTIAISPKFDRRTKIGKENAEAFESFAQGKLIIDEVQAEAVRGVVSSVKDHKLASGILRGGEAEYSYYVTCPETGLGMKCRPDYFNQNALIDLKTCQDASVEGFTRQCINLGYHIQAAYYLDVFNLANGADLKEFYFVSVETTAPFAVNTFLMGEMALALGREQYKKAMKQYVEYLKSPERINDFGYEVKINEIVFPNWAFNKLGA